MAQDIQTEEVTRRFQAFKLWDKIPFYIKGGIFVGAGMLFGFAWVSLIWFSITFLRLLLEKDGLQTVRRIYSQVTLLIMLKNLGIQVIVVCVSLVLLQIPLLDWSWTLLLGTESQNLTFAGVGIPGWGLLFLAITMLALPLLARVEELVFRATPLDPDQEKALIQAKVIGWLPRRDIQVNVEGDWKIALYLKWCFMGWLIRSITFGLVHCIIGVPLGVGLALSIGGAWFNVQYLKGGVERSTVYHTAYNLNIILVVFVVQVVSLFVS